MENRSQSCGNKKKGKSFKRDYRNSPLLSSKFNYKHWFFEVKNLKKIGKSVVTIWWGWYSLKRPTLIFFEMAAMNLKRACILHRSCLLWVYKETLPAIRNGILRNSLERRDSTGIVSRLNYTPWMISCARAAAVRFVCGCGVLKENSEICKWAGATGFSEEWFFKLSRFIEYFSFFLARVNLFVHYYF